MHNTDLLKGHLPHRVRRDHKYWAIWRNKKSSMTIYEPQTALKPPAVDTDANTPPVVALRQEHAAKKRSASFHD